MIKKTATGVVLVGFLLLGVLGCSSGETTKTKEGKQEPAKQEEKAFDHGSMGGAQQPVVNPPQTAEQAPAEITIATSTPEETVATYSSLFAAGRYEEAAKLQTEGSQKKFNGAILQAAKEDPHGNYPMFFKAYNSIIDKDVAAVASVSFSQIGSGEPTPMIDITVVKQNVQTKQWEVVNDIPEVLGKEQQSGYVQLLNNLIKLEETFQKTDFSKDGLSSSQVSQITSQIPPMLDFHRKQLTEIQKQTKK